MNLLKKYNINPNKSLGQNFLINEDILNNISRIIEIRDNTIIEVWPWYWALTEKLIQQKPQNLILVELDKKMIWILNDRINNWELANNYTKIIIDNVDILKYSPNFSNYSVIANIPYYITSPILTHFFYNEFPPQEMVILMQKDVWDKIRKVNWNKNSVLSLMCEMACDEIKEVIKVWPNNFIPAPKIDSSVIYFKLKKSINLVETDMLLKIIKTWFSEKRKKLFSNLTKKWAFESSKLTEIFEKYSINQNARAEELSLDDWRNLIKNF